MNIESSALHFSLPPNDFLGLNYERIGKSGQHCTAGFFREQDFLTILAGVKFLGSLIIGLSNAHLSKIDRNKLLYLQKRHGLHESGG